MFALAAVRSMSERHANNQRGLCKFSVKWKEKAYSKLYFKLKMTSVQCMYFLLNFWLMVLIINNYNIISTIIIIGKKVTTKQERVLA